MNSTLRIIATVLVMLAAPTFGCFAYYRIQESGVTGWQALFLSLCLPMATVGLLGVVLMWPKRQR